MERRNNYIFINRERTITWDIPFLWGNQGRKNNGLVLWNKMISKILLKTMTYAYNLQKYRHWWDMKTTGRDQGDDGHEPQPIKTPRLEVQFQWIYLQNNSHTYCSGNISEGGWGGWKDFKRQRIREFAMKFHLLVMSELLPGSLPNVKSPTWADNDSSRCAKVDGGKLTVAMACLTRSSEEHEYS